MDFVNGINNADLDHAIMHHNFYQMIKIVNNIKLDV